MKFLTTTASLLGLAAAATNALELTSENWDTETAGKTVLIRFFAPWVDNSKDMKPAWDKLIKEYADSTTQLVAEVDCTSEEGQALCREQEIEAFPTIKWGDPSALEEYEGGRDYESLEEFAETNLKPMCSPFNLDLCDDEKKKEIKKFQEMKDSELEDFIKGSEEAIKKLEKDFEEVIEGLQSQYEAESAKKDKAAADVKNSGFDFAKAVKASRANSAKDKTEPTLENWDTATVGKAVFIRFFAPWCGHSKAMEPAWDKLMEEYADSTTQLVAEVDCTSEGGQALCNANGVQGFPTLKWGDPWALEEYEGGRDYESLKEFAETNLKPTCGPFNLDLCDDEKKKKEIKKFQDMEDSELEDFIKGKEEAITKLEKDFEEFIDGLQSQYEAESAKKDKAAADVKNSGFDFAKAVKVFKSKATKDKPLRIKV